MREIASASGVTKEAAFAKAMSAFPLGRYVKPEEVAELVVFLCGAAGEAVTGQAISICGGASA